MRRRAFIRRMIFAGLATTFLGLPLPKEEEPYGVPWSAREATYPQWKPFRVASEPLTPELLQRTLNKIRERELRWLRGEWA